MPRTEPSEHATFRSLLGSGKDCLSIEDLDRFASGQPVAANMARHLETCPYCQTELQMLRVFQTEEDGQTAKDVQSVSELVRVSCKKIVGRPVLAQSRTRWWQNAFTRQWLAQASMVAAAILLVVGVMLQYRPTHNRPLLNEAGQPGQEVLRSGGFAVLNPAGDVRDRPQEIRWEKVSRAARYRVRVLEVDRSELWKAETSEEHIDLPPSLQSRIVPAKALFCEITAFDASGSKIGETGLVRFRLLQRFGNR